MRIVYILCCMTTGLMVGAKHDIRRHLKKQQTLSPSPEPSPEPASPSQVNRWSSIQPPSTSITDEPTMKPTTLTAEPTQPPLSSTEIRALIQKVAVYGGFEFYYPTAPQSVARNFLLHNLTVARYDWQYITYYSLLCIYFSTYAKVNRRTQEYHPEAGFFDMPGWIETQGWLTDTSYCEWYGVKCNMEGKVTELNLSNNRLLGYLCPEIKLMNATLEVLDLSRNYFLMTRGDYGNRWMADMTQLRRLWIGRTSFEYAGIPTHINGMTNMRELDVSNTDFSRGPIRHEAFVDLHHLYYLDLGGNVYTSTVPDSVVNLPNLEYLYLDNVVFGAGAKQSLVFLTKMPQIFECWLDHTELNGGIPTLIGQLSTLASFSASFCSLTGTLPTELGDLTAMDRMWLHQNKLAGTVPAQLSRLNSQYLTLEGNLLQGTLSACPSRVLQLGADCSATVDCPCCSCCEGDACGDFTPLLED